MSHILFSDKLHPKNGYIWTRSVKHGAKLIFKYLFSRSALKIIYQ